MLDRITQFVFGSRLQQKFALFFIVLASATPLILGGLVLYLIEISHRHDVSNLELQLIDQKTEEIEKFLVDTLGILQLRVGFTQKSEIERSQQQFLLKGILDENRAFSEASLIDLQGKETAKLIRDEDEAELQDVSSLPKFKRAAGGIDFMGEVYYTLSGPQMTLASPVRNRNNDIIQVLTAEVNLLAIVRSVESARLGASGYLLLLDKEGALVAYRGRGEVKSGTLLLGLERVKRILRGEILDGLGDRDRYESFFGREPVVGSGKKIPKLGWALLAEWPIADADGIVNDIRNQVLNFTLFSILAVLLLSPLLARRLTRPIRALEESAFEIEQGNFEKRVEIKTKDELEDLGNAFNKMAEGLKRLQELRNEFVFIAAHELRTPVTAIKGYLSMLLEGSGGKVTEGMKQYINPVMQANERLIQLVNDILDVARSEAGRIKIKVAPCDLRESIKAILVEVKPLADEKKIILSYTELEGLPEVVADEARVKEIVMNLVSNAIKYNRVGGFVKIYHEIADGKIIIHVEDNGIGMTRDDQEHMFEKFFRAESAKTQLIQGTGLGLFITKELVEKMQGKIWFVSEEGKGTRFSFSLPKA